MSSSRAETSSRPAVGLAQVTFDYAKSVAEGLAAAEAAVAPALEKLAGVEAVPESVPVLAVTL